MDLLLQIRNVFNTSIMILKFILSGILIALSVISGVWLSKMGRPLKSAIFTLHKLVSVITIILMVTIIYQLQKAIEKDNTEILFMAATGLFFVFALVSGALLSFERPVNKIILFIHKLSPLLLW
jgi:hypothetical protein